MPCRVACALGPDSAGAVLEAAVAALRSTLTVAVYELGPRWVPPLVAAARRGVAVRVLLDAHAEGNAWSAPWLAREGIPVRVVPRRRYAEAHWKLVLGDGDLLAVGTGNLIARDLPVGAMPPDGPALPGTREWWMVTTGARAAAARGRAAVRHAWARSAAPPWPPHPAGPTETLAPPVNAPLPVVPPLRFDMPATRLTLTVGGAAGAGVLLSQVTAAQERVLLTAPYLLPGRATSGLVAAMVAARARGVDVRFLLGAPESTVPRGIPVRVMDPARSTTGHAKGLVADAVAVVQSGNLSGPGLGASLEAQLRVADPRAAGYFAAAFEHDWSTGLAAGPGG